MKPGPPGFPPRLTSARPARSGPSLPACRPCPPARVPGSRKSFFAAILAGFVGVVAVSALAQQAPANERQRIDERISALQRENEELARQSQTLIGEARRLELQRDLRVEEARRAEADAADTRQALDRVESRVAELERRRGDQLPDIRAQLVDLYKRGRSRYVELLFNASSLREFARTMRAVSAMAAIHDRGLEAHRQTLEELTAERATLERAAQAAAERERTARTARAAAERAVQTRVELLASIDSRRDLTAQLAGELQLTAERLGDAIANARTGAPGAPLTPFRGTLRWPVDGEVTARFGQDGGRLGGTAVRNGIEIAAAESAPVRAIHGGIVGFADVFTGFGNLVIVDHGDETYSLYGYLREIHVERGAALDAGSELGRVGPSPAGPPGLYFEMRIDGRSVDPLQWLEQR